MSKNITISEGTQARNFNNVAKIRTNVIGGGTQNWIPEDEAADYADLGAETFDENGTYFAQDSHLDGFNQVTVNVQPDLTTGYFTENGTYYARNEGADGFESVEVNVSGGGGDARLITREITANGSYNAHDDGADGYSSILVNVPFPQHGSILDRDITNAVVSQRISTSDFISDFDEKLYTVIEPYIISQSNKVRWENLIRKGGWLTAPNFNASDILNYNNVVLVGGGGIIPGSTDASSYVCMWIGGVGFFNETASVTIDDIKAYGVSGYLYNSNDFTQHVQMPTYYMAADLHYGYLGGNFNEVINDLNNHNAGTSTTERAISFILSPGNLGPRTALDNSPHITPMTNLTGGR